VAGHKDDLETRLARVKLLALDVDGVLTDGRVIYSGNEELQAFHVRDGQGLVWLRRAGVELAWITGRGCRATELRASELGVQHLHMHARDKSEVLAAVQGELGLGPEVTAAMGDDLPDLALADGADVFACPADAVEQVQRRADLVTSLHGGRGAVRELCEAILRAQGEWSVEAG
jgi:3-deoxy-D-manno-octulosonate 8-phosphate phosphatase (KDO 8-P phosphatase)